MGRCVCVHCNPSHRHLSEKALVCWFFLSSLVTMVTVAGGRGHLLIQLMQLIIGTDLLINKAETSIYKYHLQCLHIK